MTVHEDVMLKYRMFKGNVFRKEELEEIIVADERQRAYVEALNHLSRKPRTRRSPSVCKEKVLSRVDRDDAGAIGEGQAD